MFKGCILFLLFFTLSSFSKIIIHIDNGEEKIPLYVEVALTSKERQRGLMGYKELSSYKGMLFIFDKPGLYSFWMKNTLIPLDIIYINSDKNIIDILQGHPHSIQSISSNKPAKYVLEVNAGFCQAHTIQKGNQVIFRFKIAHN